MPRPMIVCPACHRELYHLHRAECSWCGAALTEEEYEKVALPPGSSLPPPQDPLPLLPPMTQTTWFGRGSQPFAGDLFPLTNRPTSRGGRRLKTAGMIFVACLLIADVGYGIWRTYHRTQKYILVPPVYHTR